MFPLDTSQMRENDNQTGTPGYLPKKVAKKKGYIPYGSIYKTQEEFQRIGYWIPGVTVSARIVSVEKDTTTSLHLLNPWIYTVEATHGRYKWRVFKRYADFAQLAKQLGGHRRMEQIKTPFRRARHKIENSLDEEEVDEGMQYELQVLEKGKELSDFGILRSESTASSDDGNQNEVALASPDPLSSEENDEDNPHFPLVPDSMLSETQMEKRRQQLEKWLRHALTVAVNRDYQHTAEFLEVSRYSFINELGGKHQEGLMKKRPGGGKVYIGCKQFCVKWVLPWMERYLIAKDTYVCYINSNERIRLVLLFDEQFEIDSIDVVTSTKPKYMFLSNKSHVLAMKLPREDTAFYWKATMRQILETTGQIWVKPKPFGSSYPLREHNSFVQYFVDAKDYWEKAASMMELAREEIFIADWWLCPEIYMRRPMAAGNYWRLDQVIKRQAERGVKIFILLYKEFEVALNLDSLYAKKFLQGLHPNVRVIRHPDHYVGTGTFFWAHHEKLIIIDQLFAFVGGLDLCYGRWDNSTHVLADLGSVQVQQKTGEQPVTKGGGEVMEEKYAEFLNEENKAENKESDDEKEHVKHELVDESGQRVGATTSAAVLIEKKSRVGDESRADDVTPQRRTFRSVMIHAIKRQKSRSPTPFDNVPGTESTVARKQDKFSTLTPNGITPDLMNPNYLRTPDPKNSCCRELRFTPSVRTTSKWHNIRLGGDKDERLKEEPHSSSLNNLRLPRDMPTLSEPKNRTIVRRVVSNLKTNRSKKRWHMLLDKEKPEDLNDEYVINYVKAHNDALDTTGLQGAGKLWPGKDYVNYLVKDFVDVHDAYSDFINRYTTPRTPWHDIHSLVYGDVARDVARHFIQRWNATKTEKEKNSKDYPYLLPKSYDNVKVPRVFLNKDTYNAKIQVLRSVSHWSALIDGKEDSIQQAYVHLIKNAEHYVYIENQFFVSMINSTEVANEICKVLCDRIVKANRENTIFRAYIIIPLLPGFEGDLGSNNYSALMAVLHWTLLSVAKGPHSLIENLKMHGVKDPWEYVSFCSLRTYDELCGKLVTEMVYIHSKLLIVDDRYTIIGSANINDRSQLGMRDSEVCILVDDKEFIPSQMNGQPYQAGKFASSLRKRLMREHLGLLPVSFHRAPVNADFIGMDDPVHKSFYHDVWLKAVRTNTEIYEEVFRAFPTNLVSSKDELVVWRSELPMAEYNPDMAKLELKKLWGNLVRFPEAFLLNEDLAPTITTKEGLVPSAIFT